MDRSELSVILDELNLSPDYVTNIYIRGSWVYGTNTPTSDRDLIIITRQHQNPLQFNEDFDYFHQFSLQKLWDRYDVCIYSVENFEILLEKNVLDVVQCIFLPNEFKIKDEIDFRPIYLEKYFNPLRLKKAAFYEMHTDFNLYKSKRTPKNTRRSSKSKEKDQSRQYYILKHLFHGLRYLDFAEQLIRTKSIYDFKHATPLFLEMKEICGGDLATGSNVEEVAKFVEEKSNQLKSKLDELVPTNNIKGTFKAYIKLDTAEKLKIMSTKYKFSYVQECTTKEENKIPELVAVAYYDGEYPSIVEKIISEAYKDFAGFHIKCIEITSLLTNEGVPQTALDFELFWDKPPYSFYSYYKVLAEKDRNEEKLEQLRDTLDHQHSDCILLSWDAFEETHNKTIHYIMRRIVSSGGKDEILKLSDQNVQYLREMNFTPIDIEHEFSVYFLSKESIDN